MRRRIKIIIGLLIAIIIVPAIAVPLYFYGPSRATVESIVIDSVTVSGSNSFGGGSFFDCTVNISITSGSICDTVDRYVTKINEGSMKATILIYMNVNHVCLLPALYSGMISLTIVLTQYSDWTISCNGFDIILDISDYLEVTEEF